MRALNRRDEPAPLPSTRGSVSMSRCTVSFAHSLQVSAVVTLSTCEAIASGTSASTSSAWISESHREKRRSCWTNRLTGGMSGHLSEGEAHGRVRPTLPSSLLLRHRQRHLLHPVPCVECVAPLRRAHAALLGAVLALPHADDGRMLHTHRLRDVHRSVLPERAHV
jgi:hypothetical protein